MLGGSAHTGDILVEDVIFLNNIVEDLLGELVHDKHFPLGGQRKLVAVASRWRDVGFLTSPWVMSFRVLRMTGRSRLASALELDVFYFLGKGVPHGHAVSGRWKRPYWRRIVTRRSEPPEDASGQEWRISC